MTAPVYSPGQPYMLPIPGGFTPGRIAHITGTLTPQATGLVIKFQSGPSGDPNDEIGLCIYGRPAEGIVGCNAFTRGGGWGQEAVVNNPSFTRGQTVEITILCDPTVFKIALNRSHLTEFHHRLNPASLNHLNVTSTSNDINLSCIWIEDTSQPAAPPPAPYPQTPSTAPPYGAPGSYPQQSSSSPGYAPPPGMYPGQQGPPTGQYPGQYAQAPPGQYPGAQPPPPPGHYPATSPGQYGSNGSGGVNAKGLMGMVAGAGAAVAGAMGASHLVGKSKHGGGGYPSMGGGYPSNAGGYHSGGHSKGGSSMMDKAIGIGTTAYMIKNPKKGLAMKYGVPMAGVGLGGYMLSKGMKGHGFGGGFHCGSGSDSSGGSEEEE